MMDKEDLITFGGMETQIFIANREIYQAQDKKRALEEYYRKAIAKAVGCEAESLEMSSTGPCTKQTVHCVYDMRGRWPCCVFCGSPRDGIY